MCDKLSERVEYIFIYPFIYIYIYIYIYSRIKTFEMLKDVIKTGIKIVNRQQNLHGTRLGCWLHRAAWTDIGICMHRARLAYRSRHT